MAYQFPESLARLVSELSSLPGVGRKAAQRLAFHLLGDEDALSLALAIKEAKAQVHPCPRCGNFTDRPLCPICDDPTRDPHTLCVVESVADLISMERSGGFRGRYHVLGGVISPMDGIGPDDIRIRELMTRLASGEINEVVLATNPDVEGEATAAYISRLIKPMGVKVTRIAHGVPVGGELEYTDEVTLLRAFQGRREL